MSSSRPFASIVPSLMLLGVLFPAVARPVSVAVPSLDGVWSSLPANEPAPSTRREYAAVYDVQRDRYIVFGGFWWEAPGPGGLLNEVWTLTLGPHPTWSPLETTGPAPGERHSPQWGYDPVRQRLLIFGGYGRHVPGSALDYLNDVWELTLDGTP